MAAERGQSMMQQHRPMNTFAHGRNQTSATQSVGLALQFHKILRKTTWLRLCAACKQASLSGYRQLPVADSACHFAPPQAEFPWKLFMMMLVCRGITRGPKAPVSAEAESDQRCNPAAGRQ